MEPSGWWKQGLIDDFFLLWCRYSKNGEGYPSVNKLSTGKNLTSKTCNRKPCTSQTLWYLENPIKRWISLFCFPCLERVFQHFYSAPTMLKITRLHCQTSCHHHLHIVNGDAAYILTCDIILSHTSCSKSFLPWRSLMLETGGGGGLLERLRLRSSTNSAVGLWHDSTITGNWTCDLPHVWCCIY